MAPLLRSAVFTPALLLLLGGGAIAGQPLAPLGPEQQVNEVAGNVQNLATVGIAGNGDFVVAWASASSAGTDSTGYSIQARRFASDGAPLGAQVQVNTYTTGAQDFPSIAVGSGGDFVIAWRSQNAIADPDSNSVHARGFNAAGTALGDQFQVNLYTTGSQIQPVIARRPDGGFVAVWQSNILGVRLRQFGPSGAPLTGETAVNTANPASAPDLAVDPAGGFVVVWTGTGDGSGLTILGRRFASSGLPVAAPFQVNTYSTDEQSNADIARLADGGFVVVWDIGGPNDATETRGRRFTSDGSALGSDFVVEAHSTGYQSYPSVAPAPDGFVVAWAASEGAGNDPTESIQARRFDSLGAPSAQLQLNTFTTGDQIRPTLAFDGEQGWIAAWSSNGSAGSDNSSFSLQARRLRADCVFGDDFESGDLAAWDAATTGGGDLAVTAAAALIGTRGLAATIDDTVPLFVQDESPAAEDRYRARFYFDPNGYQPGQDGERIKVLQVLSTTPDQRRLVTVVLRVQGGAYKVLAKVRQDDDSLFNTGFISITDSPHFLELDWRRSSAPGANDGQLEVLVDELPIGTIAALDNDLRPAELVRLGTLGIKPGTSGTIFFDAFQSCRLLPIGPAT